MNARCLPEILEIHRAIGEGTEHGTAYDAAKKRAECPEILTAVRETR